MSVTQQAALLAERCSNAYSADRYRSWPAVAYVLLRHGLNERQAEAVMRSKWTRWAADGSSRPYGKVPAKVVLDYVNQQGMNQVIALTNETFGEVK